jgi:21S rRNA (GM2251-2'-O)-methyltransferase
MQSTKHALRILRRSPSSATCISCRHISLTGAIERGLRQSQRSTEPNREPWRDQDRDKEPSGKSTDEHSDGRSVPRDRWSARGTTTPSESRNVDYGIFAPQRHWEQGLQGRRKVKSRDLRDSSYANDFEVFGSTSSTGSRGADKRPASDPVVPADGHEDHEPHDSQDSSLPILYDRSLPIHYKRFSKPDDDSHPDSGRARSRVYRREYVGPRAHSREDSKEMLHRSIPYTTAASEFIYGTSAVNAAIRAGRRKCYKLYVHGSGFARTDPGAKALVVRAKAARIPIQFTEGPDWKNAFDRMTQKRPHNGYLLEVSPIPVLPVTSLDEVSAPGEAVSAQVSRLTPEDAAIISAFNVQQSTAKLPMRGKQQQQNRYPILLFLDRVTDLGNLGAIIRSAYYFGVNGIILLDHGTAPLSAITVKASTGAAELMPILRIRDETGFITTSKANGWHFAAAVSPEDVPLVNRPEIVPEHDIDADGLKQKPVVIMLGNEGEGLRPRIARMANSCLTVQDAVNQHAGVESLNVSVAAGILMHELMRPFLGKR